MCEYTVERTAANLPQSATHDLFTVSGGRVVVTAVLGEVTTAVQNQANTSFLKASSTVSGAVESNISTTMALQDLPVGMLISGADGPYYNVKPQLAMNPVVIASGGAVRLSCAASNTGQIKWLLRYYPLDPGAKVTAA